MALGWRLFLNYWIIKEKITTEKINFTDKQVFELKHRIKYFLLLLRWHTVGNPDISKKTSRFRSQKNHTKTVQGTVFTSDELPLLIGVLCC